MKKLLPFSGIIGGVALAVPMVAAAQTIEGILAQLSTIIGIAVTLVISLGILIFIWGLIQYLTKTGDEGARAEARNIMIWGVIIFFVAVSIWGLVEVLQSTFNVGGGGFQTPPVN